MTPEEKMLLERAVKLGEENHKILRSIQTKARWAFVWGVVRFLVIAIPLILGYLYIAPRLGSYSDILNNLQTTWQEFKI